MAEVWVEYHTRQEGSMRLCDLAMITKDATCYKPMIYKEKGIFLAIHAPSFAV